VLTEPLEEVVDLLPHAQRPVLWHLEGLLRIAYLLVCHFLLVGAALRQLDLKGSLVKGNLKGSLVKGSLVSLRTYTYTYT
jgi:hypothetical protein